MKLVGIACGSALLAILLVPGCEGESSAPVASATTSSGEEGQVVSRILALDPADPEAQAELAQLASDPEAAPATRLLALRRLEAGEAPQLVATASAILAEPGGDDSGSRNLRANALAALARAPEGEAATEAHLAGLRGSSLELALAVVAEARR